MPTAPTTGKFETHGTYGHSPKFIQLRDDLMSSAAFLSLSTTDQAILIDFIKHYNAATNFDRDESKLTKPILYTYGMCAVLVSKNTFYRSMVTLQKHGFLIDYAGADYKRGKASRWLATTRWTGWKPDTAQVRLLNAYKDRRASSVQNTDQLRFPFITYMHRAITPTKTSNDNISHISASTAHILEEVWTTNASPRPARRATK
jgi:hypothetical protein